MRFISQFNLLCAIAALLASLAAHAAEPPSEPIGAQLSDTPATTPYTQGEGGVSGA